MIAKGHYEYESTLYLHGENEYPLVEYNKATNQPETKQVYIYGATGLIATESNNETFYIIKDHLGSTRLVMDDNWNTVSWYDYLPFGNISRSGTGTELNYTYTGQEQDGEVNLMNYRARLYDSDLGRFYAIDPAGQFASPYLYCYNNTISYIDPNGLLSWRDGRNAFYNIVGIGTLIATGGKFGFVYWEDVDGNKDIYLGGYSQGWAAALNHKGFPYYGNINYNSDNNDFVLFESDGIIAQNDIPHLGINAGDRISYPTHSGINLGRNQYGQHFILSKLNVYQPVQVRTGTYLRLNLNYGQYRFVPSNYDIGTF